MIGAAVWKRISVAGGFAAVDDDVTWQLEVVTGLRVREIDGL
jgi:hypothetical protein